MSKAAVFAALATLIVPQFASVSGYASRYDEGVMEGVVAFRYDNGYWRVPPPPREEMPSLGAYIAVADCSLVGSVVEIRPADWEWILALVADCAGDDGTPQWMLTNNIIMELDYPTFMKWANEYGVPLEVEMRYTPYKRWSSIYDTPLEVEAKR